MERIEMTTSTLCALLFAMILLGGAASALIWLTQL